MHADSRHDRKATADLFSAAVRRHVAADAPPDFDKVMSTVPRSPAWVGALVGGAAVIAPWTLILLAARALLR